MFHAGTFAAGATVRIPWNTSGADGASITRATNGTLAVWKDGGVTQSTSGCTDTEDFDSMTGMHIAVIDTSADGTFYSTGSEFHVAVTGQTIDGKTVNAWIGGFRLGVVPANVTQWLGTAAATPTTAGVPEVDITHIAGSAVSTSTAQIGVNVVNFGGSAGTFASGRPEVNTTHWAGAATGASNLAMVSRATAGTMQAGSGATTAVLASGASSTNGQYYGALLYLTGGTGAGQSARIKSYVGSTRTATIDGSWAITPDNTTTYTVLPGGGFDAVNTAVATVTAVTGLTASNLDATISSRASQTSVDTIDDFLDTEVAAILADTNELQTDWADGGRLDLILDARASQTTAAAIETDTQDIQARLPAALVSGRIDASVGAMAANVLTASALATDAAQEIADTTRGRTLTEGYSTAGAAPTLEQIMFEIKQALTEFAIASTTITVKKLDGSTTAMTYTLDDATNPTSRTRAT